MKAIGMYVVLSIISIFVFSFIFPSLYIESIARRDYTGAIRTTYLAIASVALSTVCCALISMIYSLLITSNLLFSSAFPVAFVILFIIDIILLRRIGG